MNAWRSFGDPAQHAGGQTPGAGWPGANFGANFGAVPGTGSGPAPGTNGMPFAMPQMPGFASMPDFSKAAAAAMSPFAGLKLPSAAIPPERLQQLQADYSR
ncbi:MAG: class I poly(R)-hydroxyalkanoic acid synthase, partial [Paraburkholderia sp.]|nr:class I poly(R)-hydroxyalkanoic acid synthase [Paraburkholderia sp.]